MSDSVNGDLDSIKSALRQFFAELPEDLRHSSLRELRQAWADPEQRARMEPAAARLDRTVAPIMQRWQKSAQDWDRSLRSLLEP